MANKKKVEAREKARQKQKTEKTIMYAGIAIVVLVIIGLAWLLWPESAPEETAATAESTDLFSSVSGPYNAYPPMTIDPNKEYLATFKLARGGEFVVQLFADQAPKTVNNFVFLAREGYYDGTTFHRVLEGFMAQGGDPTGTGRGGPGYEFEDEFSNDLTFDREGLLAMANSGPNTNGSQFFITFAPTPHLTGRHTIFGEVVEGMEVVKSITLRDPDSFPDFPGDAIESITISER